MFDVGFAELVLIGVLALVIAGPERLPGIMRTLGRLAGRAKATFAAVRNELEREVDREVHGKTHGEARAEERSNTGKDEQER